jgi:hypothetical protein
LIRGHQADNADASSFDRLSPTFTTIYQRQNTGYGCFRAAHNLDSAQRRAACGYYILYYGNSVSFAYRPF